MKKPKKTAVPVLGRFTGEVPTLLGVRA